MRNINWLHIDIEEELRRMETLLSASLYMNDENETEHEIAINLVDKVLKRVRELKEASEVQHA